MRGTMFTMYDIPKSYIKRLKKDHEELKAEFVREGRWPFRKKGYLVSCDCSWRAKELIPLMPPETYHIVTKFLIELEMSRHLKEEAIKLGWKPFV